MRSRIGRLALAIVALVSPATLVARDFEKDAVALRRLHETLTPSVVQVRLALRRDSASTTELDLEAEGAGLVVDANGMVMVPSSMADGDGAAAPRVISVDVYVAGGARYEARWLGKARGASFAFCKVDDPTFTGHPIEFAADDSMHVGDFVASVRLSGPNFRRAPFIDAFMVSGMLDDPRCGLTSFAASDYLGSAIATLDGRVVGVIGWMSLARSRAGRDPVTGANERSLLAAIHGEDPSGRELVIVPGSVVIEAIAARPDPEEAPRAAPFLGMDVQSLPHELGSWFALKPHEGAARVSRVWADTPAAAAGFVVGDLVLGVDGESFTASPSDPSELTSYVKSKAPGETLVFDVVRDGRRITVTATLGTSPIPIDEAPRATNDAFGVHARDLVFGDRAECGLPQSTSGARMTAVSRSGHLGQAGLFVGDIVLEVDGHGVRDAAALCETLATAADAKAERVALFVQRGRRTLFVHARPEWNAGDER